MPSALALGLIFYDVFLELRLDVVAVILFVLFATVFMRFLNFRRKKKGIVVLWVLLLSFTVIRPAITVLISHLNEVLKMKSAKPEPVPTSSFEYYRSHLVDFVSNHTFNLRNPTLSCYANLTLPEFGNFRYAWDYQTIALLFLAFLNVFQALCPIKPWCRPKCHGINVALSRYRNARGAIKTSSPTTATAASTASTVNIAAPAPAAAAPTGTPVTAPVATPSAVTAPVATPSPATATAAIQPVTTAPGVTPPLTVASAATPTPVTDTTATPSPVIAPAATPTLVTGSAATLTLTTGTAATPTLVIAPVAIHTPMAGTVIPQVPAVSVAPAAKRKYKGKPDQGDGASSSEPEIVIRSLSLEELRGVKKDFSCHEGESLTTWLVRCWDNGTDDSFDLDGKEAMQLGSLARDGDIDKAIRQKAENQSLWRRILCAVKSRYPYKSDNICCLSKWTTMEKGIKYLRELAVQEIIHSDPQTILNPDEVPCTRHLLQKVVQCAPLTYVHLLT